MIYRDSKGRFRRRTREERIAAMPQLTKDLFFIYERSIESTVSRNVQDMFDRLEKAGFRKSKHNHYKTRR